MRDVYYRDRNDNVLLAWALGILIVLAVIVTMFFFMNRDTRDVDVTSIETAPIEQIESAPEPTIIDRPVIQEVPVVVPVEKPVVIEKPVIQEVPVPSGSAETSPPPAESSSVPPAGAGAR